MSNEISYSWSTGFSQSGNWSRPAPDLISFDPCYEYQLPDNSVLVVSKRSGKQAIITNDVLHALRKCDRFRTIDLHVQNISDSLPPLQGMDDEIRHILQTLQGKGLMASDRETARSLCNVQTQVTTSGSPLLFIATCDRPEALERLLVTLLEDTSGLAGHPCWVIDDSRSAENRLLNEKIVANASGSGDLEILYFGSNRQRWLIEALGDHLPDQREEIAFLLDSTPEKGVVSPGRTRNLALLLSAGERLVVLDDDILLYPHRSPHSRQGIEISSRPRAADFFGGNEEWAHLRDTAGQSAVSRHTEYLGLTLGQALNKLGAQGTEHRTIEHLLPEELDAVHSASVIKATACGYIGDPGTTGNGWIYGLKGASRRRLIESEEKYRRAQRTRNVWLGCEKPHFVTRFAFMSPVTGLDHRALLPPYFPWHRNEDFLFGEMLQFLYPDALLMDLPWAVPHLPIPERQWRKNAVDNPTSAGLLAFTGDYISARRADVHAGDAHARLEHLAALFLDLGSSPAASLRALIGDYVNHHRSARIHTLDRALRETPDAPGFWSEDITRGINVNLSAMNKGVEHHLSDIPEPFGGEKQTRYLSGSWRSFGRALKSWPRICEAAKSIFSSPPVFRG